MKTVLNTLAGLCAVSFVLAGVAALVFFNIERKAFTSESYKRAFEKQKYYERMPALLASALSSSLAEDENANPALKALTVEDWASSISLLVPPEELKTLIDGTLDSVFNYLNGRTDSAVLSVLSFKNHLAGSSGVEVVKLILRAQPPCTLEQLLQIGLGLVEGGDLILCSPPEEALALITPLIESQQQLIMLIFPDQITIIAGEKSGTPDDPRIKLNRVRIGMRITPVLPLMFLIGITIFGVRSLVDGLKWWGYPFLITGGSSLVISIIGAPIVGFVIQSVIQSQVSGFIPTILFSALRDSVNAVSRQILTSVAVAGIILAILGLGMVIAAGYVVKKDSPSMHAAAKKNQ